MTTPSAFEQAMADHMAELRMARERRRALPVAAQLGVVGVAGGTGLVWLGEGLAGASQAAGIVAALAGMTLYLASLLTRPVACRARADQRR